MVVSERGPVQQEAEAGFAALTEGSGSHHPPPPLDDGSAAGEPPSPPAPLASNGEEGSESGSPKLHPSDSKQSSFAPASSAGSDADSGTGGAASGGSGPEITHYDSRWGGGLPRLYAVTISCAFSVTWDEGKQR